MKNYHHHKIESRPAVIEVDGGITIRIDENNNINIEGHNDMNFNCSGDLNINAKKINMMGNDDVRVESKTHMVYQAPRIDFNPDDVIPTQEELDAYMKSMVMQANPEEHCCEGHEH